MSDQSPEQAPTETMAIGHSGNAPLESRELPSTEFGSTSLEEAHDQKLLIIPEDLSTIPHTEIQASAPDTTEVDAPRFTRKQKIIASITAALVLLGIGGGVVAAHQAPAPQTTTSAGPNPSSTPESTPVASPTPEVTAAPETMPASLEKYKAMTLDQFAALPKPEQMLYFGWLTRGMAKFAADYHAAEVAPGDPNNVLPSVAQSTNNSIEQAMTFSTYAQRMSLSFTGLDAEKAAVASLANPTGSDAVSYKGLQDSLVQLSGGGLEAWMQGAKGDIGVAEVTSASDYMTDTNGFQYKNISGKNPTTGQPVAGRVTFVPYIDPITNQPTGQWLN